jgi:predicted PurR-regulated permease PerM
VDQLSTDLVEATASLTTWLSDGPLQLSETDIESYIDTAVESIRENVSGITSGVLGGATLAIELITGVILLILAMFFFLKDGDRAVRGVIERSADPERVRRGMEAAWATLSSYVRGLVVVGAVDAVFIGVGLAIVGTPLVAVLMMLVFIGAFFPVIGAFLSGLVAVAVTLVNGGLVSALVVLGIVIGVQQFEGHILYPIVFRRALSLHPLVILLALAVGGVAFGLVGAFLAVPIAAVAVAVHQAVVPESDRTFVALLSSRPYEHGADGQDIDRSDDSAVSDQGSESDQGADTTDGV